LQAIIQLIEIYNGQSSSAAGIQISREGAVNYYCIEIVKENGRCAVAYNPRNGQFRGSRVCDGAYLKLDQLIRNCSAGEEYLLAFAYASIEKEGNLLDSEFCQNFNILAENMRTGWREMEKSIQAAYICCDNIYRRVEDIVLQSKMRLPLDKSQLDNDVVPLLDQTIIKSGIYSPNSNIKGTFQVFNRVEKKKSMLIRYAKETYYHDWNLSPDLRLKIPQLPEKYEVKEELQEILEMVDKTPARFFLLSGGAGVGKSTDAQIVAQVLGLPYYGYSCGPDTDETELLVTMVPNMKKSAGDKIEYPMLEDFMMDPASALAKITGKYEKEISSEESFQKVMQEAFQRGFEKAKAEKDFVMVESAIIEACKGPSVLEIREPTVMRKSAALTKLNSLFDDSAEIELINGETIRRHPNTIVILTTNMSYIGCQMFNESTLSRMNVVQHREELTAKEMVERVQKKMQCGDEKLLKQMAAVVIKIDNHIKEHEIQGGVCGYREFENWVWNYTVKKNVLHAVKDSVLSKASMDEEERQEIMDTYIAPYFEHAL